MGGPGSTRWRDHQRKPRVEDTLCLDLLESDWRRALARPWEVTGTATWPAPAEPLGGEPDGEPLRAHWRLSPLGDDPDTRELRVHFEGQYLANAQVLPLARRRAGFGWRWFARCPDCDPERWGRKLYSPLVGIDGWFACWRCHGLTHATAQEHDRRIDDCRRAPRKFLAERSRLGGDYSELVTAKLYWIAAQRGFEPGPEEMLAFATEGLTPEDRAVVEEHFARMRRAKRLAKRRDRLRAQMIY